MSAFAKAFMAAFQAQQKWVDADGGSVDYQCAVNAMEGAKARARFGVDKCPTHRAIAALVAYEEVEAILAGIYTLSEERDDVERDALRRVQETLRDIWRHADAVGGAEARPYAIAVGAPEKRDSWAWGQFVPTSNA